MTKVFIYGTLRRGGALHPVIEDSKFMGEAVATGIMFSLGRFPGVHFLPDAGRIYGEIYKVTPETLNKLDAIEGFHPDKPEISMYVRRRIEPLIPMGKIFVRAKEVWAYEYRTEGAKFPRVPHGDWIKHSREDQNIERLVNAARG